MNRTLIIFALCAGLLRAQAQAPAPPAASTPGATQPAGAELWWDLAISVARGRGADFTDRDAREASLAIDQIVEFYKKRAAGAANGREKLAALAAAMFDDARLESVTNLASAGAFYVDRTLKTRRGYCLSLSMVALGVAERAGLPLAPAAAPNHFYLQYREGAESYNFETTRRGALVADADYLARAGDSPPAFCFKPLTRRQVEAILIHNRGFVIFSDSRQSPELRAAARADFEKAILLFPEMPEAHRNLGVLLGEEGNFAAAKKELDAGLLLYPSDADALMNRAICKQKLGDDAGAIEDLRIALILDPSRTRAREMLEQARVRLLDSDFVNYQKTVVAPVSSRPAGAVPGLEASFYNDTAFGKFIKKRIDHDLDFDWQNSAPERGVPADRFSVRWEGLLLADAAAKYTIFVVANDGVRVVIDDKVILENWRDMGFENWYGTADAELIAGYHKFRVEYYDQSGGARMLLKIGVDGREQPLELTKHFFHFSK